MALTAVVSPVASLRAVNFRLQSTPKPQLPQVVSQLSSTLQVCGSILSSPQNSASKDSSETSVAVHKFKTLLTSLITDRSVEARFAAVVLIKTAVELGGWEILQKSGQWVRGLLSVLSRPEPRSIKKLAVIALTRIFLLTRDYPTLVREITTPSLTPFITSCLNSIDPKQTGVVVPDKGLTQLVHVVLESFSHLLPRHPTTFRPHQSQIQRVLSLLVAPTPSDEKKGRIAPNHVFSFPSETLAVAQRVLVQLHHCAPKAGSGEAWEKGLGSTILNTHRVADRVFRAVIEDWQSTSGYTTSPVNVFDGIVQDPEADGLGFPGWVGIYAGGERMVGLLGLLKEYVNTPVASSISFPIGRLVDLLNRIFSITSPSTQASKDWQSNVRLNNQVGREERESLWSLLPRIHVAGVEILIAIMERFEAGSLSVMWSFLDQLNWIFSTGKNIPSLRTAVYESVSVILHRSGASLPKQTLKQLTPIIRSCCNDLLPETQPNTSITANAGNKGASKVANQSTNADSFLNGSKPKLAAPLEYRGLHTAAYNLLPVLLRLPTVHISDSLRTRMDRTAILLLHKEAMLSSVLNPPVKSGRVVSSIAPILARAYAEESEMFLRPRMPVIKTGTRNGSSADHDEEMASGDEEEEEPEPEADLAHETPLDAEASAIDTAMEAVAYPVSNPLSSLSKLQDDTTRTLPEHLPPSSKRPQPETESAPSPKRTRLASPPTAPPANPASSSSVAQPTPAIAIAAQPPFVPTQTSLKPVAAMAPTAAAPIAPRVPPAPAKEDDDSDDDEDFGTLVMGQDTDEEE